MALGLQNRAAGASSFPRPQRMTDTAATRFFRAVSSARRFRRTSAALAMLVALALAGCADDANDGALDDGGSGAGSAGDTGADEQSPPADAPDGSGDGTEGWLQARGWTNVVIGELTGTATIEFDLRADASPVNAVAGLSLGRASAYTDLAIITRLNPDGQLDVRDGDDYAADESISYDAGRPYHVVIEADLDQGRYDAFVERDGQRIAIRGGAAFRSESQVSSVDRLVLFEVDSLAAIGNLTIDGVSVPLVAETDGEPPPGDDPGEPPVPSGGLWAVDFQQSPVGTYTDDRVRADWQGTRWANTNGRVEVQDEAGNRYLRVSFPQGGVGPGNGGAQWMVDFAPFRGRTFERLYVSYRVRFRPGFDFVQGGKLPGLVGGAANTGGDRPNGSDGWSGRMMWRREGAAVQYLYHPDQPGTYGEDLDWTVAGAGGFTAGEWITVEHLIVMNTPGQRDGLVRGWYNGVPALERTGLRFRDVGSFAIDGFFFSTFFGGSGPEWAPTRDEYIDFDDFVFSDQPITH